MDSEKGVSSRTVRRVSTGQTRGRLDGSFNRARIQAQISNFHDKRWLWSF
jgi:hypothetical protein